MSGITQLSKEIFSEDIYFIRTRLIILISDPWEKLPEPDKHLLNKIIEAIHFSASQVTIISVTQTSLNELSRFNPRFIISFGVPIAGVSEDFTPVEHGDMLIIPANALGEMDQVRKEKLWAILKSRFPRQ
jgi:hypothetical protein